MSDIDALVKAAEGRIAKSGRSALARARAEDRLSRLVEATAASAARSPRTSSWRWIASGGVVVLAGVVLTSVFTRTPAVSSAQESAPTAAIVVDAPIAANMPIGTEAPPWPPRALVAVESLPSAPEAASPVRPHVAAAASVVRVEPAAATTAERAPSALANPSPEALAPANPSSEAPAVVTESAAALFERANGARRGGDYASAEKLYRRLLDSYPGSREAATSRIVLGRMLLSRNDVGAALALFDRYLAESPKASLSEQALVGRAQCLQKLSRREEERAAWRLLLDTFPGSPNRAEALERLR